MDILRKDMRYNADFDESVVIRREGYRWLTSPMPGVERMMLDHIGGEVARARQLCVTSLTAHSRHITMMVARNI